MPRAQRRRPTTDRRCAPRRNCRGFRPSNDHIPEPLAEQAGGGTVRFGISEMPSGGLRGCEIACSTTLAKPLCLTNPPNSTAKKALATLPYSKEGVCSCYTPQVAQLLSTDGHNRRWRSTGF